MTDAELRNLLTDCLKLWDMDGRVTVHDSGLSIDTPTGQFTVRSASSEMRPLRWFYQTPERAAANRPQRAAPSVVALLSALRNAMEGSGGDRLRVGA